jgi:hypothetical protein
MQCYPRRGGIRSTIRKMFCEKEPNAIHRCLYSSLQCGMAQSLITTNYDLAFDSLAESDPHVYEAGYELHLSAPWIQKRHQNECSLARAVRGHNLPKRKQCRHDTDSFSSARLEPKSPASVFVISIDLVVGNGRPTDTAHAD